MSAETAMDGMRPTFLVVAGINGAGKSTFFQAKGFGSFCSRDVPWVNTDNIVIEQGGSWNDASAQLAAGKTAVRCMKNYLNERVSFCEETTLAGRTCLARMRQAKERGFRVVMCYIGLASARTAKERIAHRVATGGHHIPDEVVERRFSLSLGNVNEAIRLCDEAYVFDNEIAFRRLAAWRQGYLVEWNDLPLESSWLLKTIEEEVVEL